VKKEEFVTELVFIGVLRFGDLERINTVGRCFGERDVVATNGFGEHFVFVFRIDDD